MDYVFLHALHLPVFLRLIIIKNISYTNACVPYYSKSDKEAEAEKASKKVDDSLDETFAIFKGKAERDTAAMDLYLSRLRWL